MLRPQFFTEACGILESCGSRCSSLRHAIIDKHRQALISGGEGTRITRLESVKRCLVRHERRQILLNG
jgi:hypothetical protein